MNLDLGGQSFIARIFPSRRTAKRERQKTRSGFTGFDDDGCLGGGNFSRKFRSVRMGRGRRSAADEERRPQCETTLRSQDGRTV
jgi:hypothetical protein